MNLDEVVRLAGLGHFAYEPWTHHVRISDTLGDLIDVSGTVIHAMALMRRFDKDVRREIAGAIRQARAGTHGRACIGFSRRGDPQWLQLDIAPSQPSPTGDDILYGCCINISEPMVRAHRAQAQADEARVLAANAGQLLSALSHEIRTPLGAILGLARIGDQESGGRSIQALFHRIEASGQYLLDVVDKILDYTALKADRLLIERTQVNVAEVIDRSIEFVAERAHAKRLPILVDEAPGLPDTFMGDPLRITQILVNLLGNAIKFTHRGHITFSIEPRGRNLRFEVKDTGIGIEPQAIDHIFEPFTQGHQGPARDYGGTGLGLAISEQLATTLGANLEVTSTRGVGSCFCLTLPLDNPVWPAEPIERPEIVIRLAGLPELEQQHLAAQLRRHGYAAESTRATDAYAHPVPACLLIPRGVAVHHSKPPGLRVQTIFALEHGELPAESAGAETAWIEAPLRVRHLLASARSAMSGHRRPQTQDLRILVADDCPMNRLIVEDILKRAGVSNIRMFESGTEAISEVVTREPNYFDAAILDIQMPGMDGIETATQLRNISPQLPVIALSGESDPETQARALDAGMIAFLTKPVDDDTLLSAVFGEHRAMLDDASQQVPGPARQGESQVFDIRRMQRRFSGHDALVDKLVSTFRRRHRDTPERLRSAANNEDWQQVGQIAHTLKGMAGHLQAIELYLSAQKVSNAIRNHGRAAPPYLNLMQDALERVIAALDALHTA